jgi:hypothetical protein
MPNGRGAADLAVQLPPLELVRKSALRGFGKFVKHELIALFLICGHRKPGRPQAAVPREMRDFCQGDGAWHMPMQLSMQRDPASGLRGGFPDLPS